MELSQLTSCCCCLHWSLTLKMLHIANSCFWMLPVAALSDLETAVVRQNICLRAKRLFAPRPAAAAAAGAAVAAAAAFQTPPNVPSTPPRPAGPTRPRRSSATPRARTPAPATGTAAGAWRRPSSRPRPVAAAARWRRRHCRLEGCPTTAATAAGCSTTRWGLRRSRLDRRKAAWVQWH